MKQFYRESNLVYIHETESVDDWDFCKAMICFKLFQTLAFLANPNSLYLGFLKQRSLSDLTILSKQNTERDIVTKKLLNTTT